MANFVFVASGVSNERFEKAMEVKIKAGDLVKFLPQGHPQNQGGITSPGMTSSKLQTQPNGPDVLTNVRFEWDQAGAEFGAEIALVLAGKVAKQEQKNEAAA
jgi:hypothetical protein